jgi:ABC-type multidrug transport system ATPase subunit
LRFPLSPHTRGAKHDALKKRVDETIRTLGLEEQRKTRIKRLSGGQRKRVSLGIELLTSPPLLFLDEPTSGLDPGLEERMMKLFHSLAKEGRTVIVTTHIMESLQLLDLVALLVKGNLVFCGPPQQALKAFQVGDFSDIYAKLEQYNPAALAKQFRQSALYKKYVTARLAKRYKTEAIPEKPEKQRAPAQKMPQKKSQRQSQIQKTPKQPPTPETMNHPSGSSSIDEELARLKQRLKEDS